MKIYTRDLFSNVVREVEFIKELSEARSLILYKDKYAVIENKDILSAELQDKAKKLNNSHLLYEKYYKKYNYTRELIRELENEIFGS